MLRRVSALVLKGGNVLMVKLKSQDRLMPRATWVFPYLEISEDMSPRREITTLLNGFSMEYDITGKVFKYSPSENPKLTYYLYVVLYKKGEPDVLRVFQAYKWVPIRDITAYSTSFMDGNVSKYLNEVADKLEKENNLGV